MILTHPSYDNINYALKQLIEYLDRSNFQPEVVVGLARGGLHLALCVSHSLHIPMAALHYSSKKGKGDDRNHVNQFIDLSMYKRILVVDDITDSGHSMKEVHEHYSSRGFDIKTGTIYHKESSVFTPDYHWYPLPEDAPFIFFPWERNIKYMNF